MKHHNIAQQTEEWFELRKGKFTASTFKDLFASTTTKQYEQAIYKVVFERMTGERVNNGYENYDMKRGKELEPEALKKYELLTFNKVNNGGFFEYDEWIGCSPDGLIDEDGLVQVKCPKYNTMINYLLKKELPIEYMYQVHGELLVTGRKWNDFFAYHPALEPIILRIERDEEICKMIMKKIKESIVRVKEITKQIKI